MNPDAGIAAPAVGFTAFGLALLVGVGFGWFLERGGMGNARKLAAQFYGSDMAVLKVMFSAILTAMLGLFWLGYLGFVDVSSMFVPGTWLLPQVLGGVIFGVGFVVCGLCPGTSCVAASSGRLDGVAVIGGMLAGVLVFAEALPFLEPFYEATAAGPLTLPDLVGLPYGVVVACITLLGLAAFRAAEWAEGHFGSGAPVGPTRSGHGPR